MPCGAGLSQPILLGDRVQHRQVRGMPGHVLAPEGERILAGGERQLVHEGLDEHRVLVDVHAAPEARRHVRVAHRVVDQQVRDVVAERVLAAVRFRPWKVSGSRAFCCSTICGRTAARIDCPEMPDVQAGEVVVGVEAAGQLAVHHRVVVALHHVLFARPQQLDRRAGHLPSRSAPPGDVVLERAAPPEAAAEVDLVDVALLGRQAGGGQQRGEARPRRPASAPRLRTVRRVARRGVHRLHRRVVLERVGVDRLDLLRRAGERRLRRRRSGCRRTPAPRRGRPSASRRCSRSRPWRSGPRPTGSAAASSAVFACHQVSATTATAESPTCTTFFTPFMLVTSAGVEALDLAAEHRAVLDRRVQHAGQLQVEAVDLLAGDLVGGVEPRERLADRPSSPSGPSASRPSAARASRPLRPPCRRSSCGRTALCVMTLFATVHSEAGTFHWLAAAWTSMTRAVAPPLRT